MNEERSRHHSNEDIHPECAKHYAEKDDKISSAHNGYPTMFLLAGGLILAVCQTKRDLSRYYSSVKSETAERYGRY
jgi:hypothetical protein